MLPLRTLHTQQRQPQWQGFSRAIVRSRPLPDLSRATDRWLTRFACLIALKQIVRIRGFENLLPQRDPFLLVANHSSRREALFLPALLLLARGGRPVRFLADWNFRLIPGVSYIYRRSGAITLTRKDARPRVLNLLRSRFRPDISPLEEAKHHLLQGGAVGIFPEGTVNRNADSLLRGRRAAARLSIEAQVPVVPVGIRFDRRRANGLVDSSSAMSIHVGTAMYPSECDAPVSPRLVAEWNRQIMSELSRLCGKAAGVDQNNPSSRISEQSAYPPLPFTE